jgi:hypothetical protein
VLFPETDPRLARGRADDPVPGHEQRNLPAADQRSVRINYSKIGACVKMEKMNKEDIQILVEWFEQNKDHKLNILEKEAIKLAVRKASTVGDLLKTALDLLKK